MGEVLLAHHLAERGATAEVASAGFLTVDRPPEPEVVELMAARGLDVSGHRSRLLEPAMVDDADLVIGMARQHVREAAMLTPDGFAKTYSLKELVRRGERVGARGVGEDLATWSARVGERRTPAGLLGESTDDDVADPIGRRFKVFKQVAAEIDDLSARLSALLAP